MTAKVEFGQHIAKIKSYVVSAIRSLYILRDLCPKPLLRTLYFALVNSRLDYGISVWGGTYLETLRPLITLQKHCVRVICCKRKYCSSWPLFKSSNIYPLRYLFVYKVLKLFYIRGGYLNTKNVERYNLRTNNQCVITFTRKEYCRRACEFISPVIFNSLPNTVKSSPNLKKFKKNLREKV